jgi:hypothetical protein
MTTRSSYLLAVLLIANPFMLLAFQNCSSKTQERTIASSAKKKTPVEYSEKIDSKLKIQ